MKLKSLLVGSVAAVGLSAGTAMAADANMSIDDFSLDFCDSKMMTGITISSTGSNQNCMLISGDVTYTLEWNLSGTSDGTNSEQYDDTDDDGQFDELINAEDAPFVQKSLAEWNLDFDVRGDSDFGTTRAFISLTGSHGGEAVYGTDADFPGLPADMYYWDESDDTVTFDEAWVSFGDTTVVAAGLKGSVAKFSDLGGIDNEDINGTDLTMYTGGHVIQLTHDFGNGLSVSKGLENIDGAGATPGTAGGVGVIAYDNGDGFSGHLTVLYHGWDTFNFVWDGFNAAVAFSVDQFAFDMAVAGDGSDYIWAGQVAATFDAFDLTFGGITSTWDDTEVFFELGFQATDTVKVTARADYNIDTSDAGFSGTVEAMLSDYFTLNLSAGTEYNGDPAYAEAGLTFDVSDDTSVSKTIRYESDGDIVGTFSMSKSF
ncbi:hypothetical protein [Cucumibacter marinus]|uniref:hypothetical protein n=1 Tax=Cucumibacter marinus TaxID=1121252 RepID=UPI00040896F3|nr:hypothetical protein [Cucumibacter marinus]